jgi:hypothetical protein
MYGKHFASMYEGSLYGAGAVVFAVWGYVIATQVPDRGLGSVVVLNPRKLADTLGEAKAAVEQALHFLCLEDSRSTTKKEGGRRLKRVSEFEYQVVNGAKYRAIRNEDERRAQNREAKRRERLKKAGVPAAGEARYCEAVKAGVEPNAEDYAPVVPVEVPADVPGPGAGPVGEAGPADAAAPHEDKDGRGED